MKTKKIKSIGMVAAIALAVLTFSQNTYAQDKPQRERPDFAKLLGDMDADEDGKLSLEEVKGPLKENFEKVDANGDGFITKEEFEKAPKPERKAPPRRK